MIWTSNSYEKVSERSIQEVFQYARKFYEDIDYSTSKVPFTEV